MHVYKIIILSHEFPSLQEPRPHNFKTTTFFHPTFCAHCGSMIYGLINQGVRCTDCGMCSHKKCQGIVPRTCGTHTQEKRGRINIGYYTQRLKEDQWRINVEGMYVIAIRCCACGNRVYGWLIGFNVGGVGDFTPYP